MFHSKTKNEVRRMESLHERMVRPPTPCHALMALLPARQWPAVQCPPPS